MGKISIRNKITVGIVTLLLLCSCLAFYVLWLLDQTDTSQTIAVKAKIEFGSIVEAVEEGRYDSLERYKGIYVTNDGIIQKSTIRAYEEAKRINLHRFSAVNGMANESGVTYFQSPVIRDGVQIGTLLIAYEPLDYTIFERYGFISFFPVLILPVLIFALLVWELRLIYMDILYPLSELSNITKRILRHDYETRLTYDYSSEIGELCHDLEMLRDELYHTRKREEKLKKEEKELLACISHDLKTPLASVSGYVEGIQSNVVTSKAEVDRYLDIILKKVRFITKLIDDILEQSKRELNEFSIHLTEQYAKDLLEELLAGIAADTAKAGYAFVCDEIPNVMVWADKDRLFQVIYNIVGNSMKYTEQGGTISCSIQVYEEEMVIALGDNGQGISVSDIPFVFHKFYRGEQTGKGNVQGSGLGLYIAKYIVECHGGRIECDSVRNEGTTVRFSIRLC